MVDIYGWLSFDAQIETNDWAKFNIFWEGGKDGGHRLVWYTVIGSEPFAQRKTLYKCFKDNSQFSPIFAQFVVPACVLHVYSGTPPYDHAPH